MKLKIVFNVFSIIILIIISAVLITTFLLGYQSFLTLCINSINAQQHSDKIAALFTEGKFNALQVGLLCYIIIFVIITYLVNRYYTQLWLFLSDLFKKTGIFFTTCFKDTSLRWLCLLPLGASLYFAVTLPISYDEAWTYINFTNKGIISSVAYYPAPNNHVLHSILTNVANFFFSFWPKFSLRVFPFIVNLMTIIICYAFIKKNYNEKTGILTAALSPLLFMNLYYSYMSRGYGIVFLCFITSLYFIFNIIKQGGTGKDWFMLTLFSIIGFYTVPSYLYAYVILNLIHLVLSQGKNIFKQIASGTATIMITVILYTPIIMINGIKALTSNKYIVPLPRNVIISKIPDFLNQLAEDLFKLPSVLILIIILITFIFFIKNKDWFHVKLISILITAPLVILIAHAVIPYSRTYNYYSFVILYLFIISISSYISALSVRSIFIIAFILQGMLILNFSFKIKQVEHYSIVADKIAVQISGNGKKYFVSSGLFDAHLVYQLKVDKISNYQCQYFPEIKANADTINNFDYIIIDRRINETRNKKPVWSNEYFNVY